MVIRNTGLRSDMGSGTRVRPEQGPLLELRGSVIRTRGWAGTRSASRKELGYGIRNSWRGVTPEQDPHRVLRQLLGQGVGAGTRSTGERSTMEGDRNGDPEHGERPDIGSGTRVEAGCGIRNSLPWKGTGMGIRKKLGINFGEMGPNNETVRSRSGRRTAKKTGDHGGGARWPSARCTDLQVTSGSGLEEL
jgi:hypothetical protein